MNLRVYIVHLSAPYAEVAPRLAALPGVRPVRELPPHQAVVALEPPATEADLRAAAGVTAVVRDRLEHPLSG